MIKIKIITPGNTGIIESDAGHALLDILRKNGYNLYAPCGGKGTCGKCRVKIKDEGEIIAARFLAVLPEFMALNLFPLT